MAEHKQVDHDRFFWNPVTGDKVHTHYADGTPIKLDKSQEERAAKATKACIANSNNERTVHERKKTLKDRGVKDVAPAKTADDTPAAKK